MPTSHSITFEPIGVVHSCFKEKFGIPRQPGLARSARAVLELTGEYAQAETVRGLEHCSHLWVLFLFSEHSRRGWTPLVRPPRSQGAKMGVFATRSTFRPNPIGMSAVKLERIEFDRGRTLLHLRGADILDGTPVLDIKPYLPYSDSILDAENQYAPDGQRLDLPFRFSIEAQDALTRHPRGDQLQQLIREVLCCDPRPVHQRKGQTERVFGTLLEDVNVRWQIHEQQIDVLSVDLVPQERDEL